MIRRRKAVQPTPSLLAAHAAQRESARRRAAADRSGERLAALASAIGVHLEANNFGPRLEAALMTGRRTR